MDSPERGMPDFPFSIGHVRLNEEGFITHGHDYSELVIIYGGRGIHKTGVVAYPVAAGDVFVIRKGEVHGFQDCRNLDVMNIPFHSDFPGEPMFRGIEGVGLLFDMEPRIRETGNRSSLLHVHPVLMEDILEICREMEHEISDKKTGYQSMFKSHLTRLMIILGRCYTDGQSPAALKMKKIAGCLAEMEERFDEDLDIAALAEKEGYSREHFIRLFRKYYATTPGQYILQLRMARAAELLRKGELLISEIAWNCGFEDSNYFARIFKQKMGLSPREYRKTAGRE